MTEDYDVFGRIRTEEPIFDDDGNSLGTSPVDTLSTIRVESEFREIENVSEFVTWLDETGAGHACFVQHYFRFSIGRAETETDGCALEAVRMVSVDEPISAAMKSIVLQPQFSQRVGEQ